MFASLSDMELLLAGLATVILFFLGYKIGGFLSARKSKRDLSNLKTESHNTSKSLKRILEEEKNQVVAENVNLTENNKILNQKVEDYRKKLAGMGMLNFSGGKKRADILYSLLLENEALEQLLAEQGDKLAGERKEHLFHRMKDIGKRQRLLAEIFNDETIKNYVKDVLSDDGRIEAAANKIENDLTDDHLLEGKKDSPEA
jgi:hypothetical protein